VTYARLPAGTYRFSVRAVNEDGQSSPVPATIDFRVLAPFWRQGWFVATGLALVVLAAAGTYRFRMRRLIELERLRTRIASDLHDDMGATLSQIAILGEVARARAGAVDPGVEEPLARISTLSRESVDAMSDIVWAIDPHKDRMENLAQRMRRHASDVLPPLGIPFTFDVADEHVTLGADVRREVFLAFKESLNNAIKHADCRSVSVALRAEASSLVLTVADDGRGFDPACVTPGHGLGSLRRRAESLGGSLHVESQGGTRVTFRIPYRGRRTHLNR
jgi:signal transduction histidine kinase